MNLPRYSDIRALSCDVYKSVIVISKTTTVYPNIPRIWFYLNPIYIMTPSPLKLKIAYNYILTFFQS